MQGIRFQNLLEIGALQPLELLALIVEPWDVVAWSGPASVLVGTRTVAPHLLRKKWAWVLKNWQ